MINPFDNRPVRFLNKDVNQNERQNYDGWWDEQIQMYGTDINFFTNTQTIETQDNLYGEEPTSVFSQGKKITIVLNLSENAIVMQKFGLIADDEVTAFIHIGNYFKIFGDGVEPKAGDVFDLSEFGEDRPGGRSGKHFEITERVDQDVSQINPLIGHYVWLVRAKRHDYSFEPGLKSEEVSQQLDDTLPLAEDSDSIFDYHNNGGGDDVYGGYV